jgi:hypothetical protein
LNLQGEDRNQCSCFDILSVARKLARNESLHASPDASINDLELLCEASSTECGYDSILSFERIC